MVSKSLSVILFVVILNTFASCERSTTIKPASDETCSTKLSSCEIDGKVEIIGKPGETGPAGLKGDKGEPGRDGLNGKDGVQGKEGKRGHKGDKGISGNDGTAGAAGPKGEPGPRGIEGDSGEKGEIGFWGLQGAKGDAGLPGSGGVCGCPDRKSPSESDTDLETWATKDDPGKVPCKNAPEHKKRTEFYYLKDGFQVKCDLKTKMTCISSNKHKDFFYKQSQPFWLSQEYDTLKDIYDLDSHQLSWLQKQSFTAELTIRYHCLNSKPVGNNSVVLLTWNDVKIGPKPTETTSFHYHVRNDFCSNATGWNYTDIVIVSPIAQRLPIVDFFITDVSNDNQALHIEIRSLCFG